MKPEKLLSHILNKLFFLTILFYGGMFASNVIWENLDDRITNALESAGTLTLGALIGIARDRTDDDNDNDNGGEFPPMHIPMP